LRIHSIISALGLTLIGCNSQCSGKKEVDVVAQAQAFYDSRPYFQQPVLPLQATPEGLPDMRAETCGACHQEIYQEWKISTHARAWLDDAQFQEELHKSRGEGDDQDVSWMCVNCHTPVVNQLPRLVVGLKGGNLNSPEYVDNPHYDKTLQLEAITCATCHVRDGKILGPYGDPTHAPHPVQKSDELVSESTCTRCHQAEAVFPEINLGCFFTTGQEWKESPAAKRGETCQHCHMPEVERAIAVQPGLPIRTTRRHWFGGSLIPKHPDYEPEIAPLRSVYGSGVDVELHRIERECDKYDPCHWVEVEIANNHAGHHVPSGDPERHMIITLTARDVGDFFHKEEIEIASRYKWWPSIEKLTDNRIPAGKKHTQHVELPGKHLTLELKASKYRMFQDAFDYHKLEGRYVRGRVFHESTFGLDEKGKLTQRSLRTDTTPSEPKQPEEQE